MVVQHNLTAMNANRYFGINNSSLSKSLEKLSSGYAINRAGDNAAGLAVSEKMRAQISGLTQASKNAEDGISMVQTYEGALTETDSILQRMRSLAVQSANGSYDNSVDRVAIEQEFKQLNDELDQIADTDFNGVIVLNGGVMADGTEAVGGQFKYVANDPRTDAMQFGTSDINTLDSKGYNSKTAAADALWTDLGLTDDDESVELTMTYDKATDTWSITDSDNSTALANKDEITITRGATGTENNGGFSLQTTTGTHEIANVVMDATDLVNGDTVKLTFTRPKVSNTAAENIGIADGSFTSASGTGQNVTVAAPTLAVNDAAAAANKYVSTNGTGTKEMTQLAADSFNALDGAKFDVTYTEAAVGTGTAAVSGLKVTMADGTEKTLALDATTSLVNEAGIKLDFEVTDAGVITVKDANGGQLATITPGTATCPDAAVKETATASFKIALDTAKYSAETEPKVSVVEPNKETKVSKSDSNNASTTTLTYSDHIALQVGARTKDLVDFTFAYDSEGIGDLEADLNCTSKGLGTSELSLASQESANAAIDKIDNAINKVSMVRGTFGAIQNRLEHKISNLDTTNENLTAAESRIRDTDMASEMMEFTKNQILSQASQSMLAQANQLPQGVLSLLQ